MLKPKLIRTSTIALSLDYLLKGQLAFLKNHFEVVAVSGADAHLENVTSREGVRTVAVTMQRRISPVKDLVSLWQLYRLFRKEKPQIVHSITPKAGLLSMTAAYFARVPVRIHTFTGLIFPSKTGGLHIILITMDKLLCLFATHIYPEGEGVKKDLIDYGITKKPLKVIANGNVNGIDITFFNPENYSIRQNQKLKKDLGIKEDDFIFIFIGRLVGDKGINELVQAFQKMAMDITKVKLLLVGPFELELDPLADETLAAIKRNAHILTVGLQPDVRPYFAISNALVFPSYREGFPNVVLQAGAMGLPSIVSDINGCNEIIINEENGLIIPSKNTELLAAAMRNIVHNPSLHKKLRHSARARITENYEQKFVWEAILAEYKRLTKDL